MEENKTKEPSKINWHELLRYPVITLCIILGFLLLKVVVGFDLSGIAEITKDGIRFRDAETTQTIQQLTMQVSAMAEKQRVLDSLLSVKNTSYHSESSTSLPVRTRTNSTPVAGSEQALPEGNTAGSQRKNHNNWTATETAADNVAQLSYVDSKGTTFLKNKEGYIWLGENDSWDNLPLDYKREVRIINGKPNIPFRKYKTSRNIILREYPVEANEPSQTEAIGIIPKGVAVSIKEIEESAGTFWAKIIVEE